MISKNFFRNSGDLRAYLTLFTIVLLMIIVIQGCTPRTAQEGEMTENRPVTEAEFNQKYAAGLNGLVWNLLEKEERTAQEEDLMVHAAHTSYFHWSRIGTPENLQRGEWLISRVYAVLNRPEGALHHAERCLELTREHNLVDFDLAYAYEGMARANASAGNRKECEKYLKLANEAGENIAEQENLNLFFDDLNSDPWYGGKIDCLLHR